MRSPRDTHMGGGPESLGVSRGAVFAGCRRQGGATVSENAAPRRRKGQIRAARPVSGCRRPFPPPEPRRTRRVHRGASLTVGRRGVEPPKPLQSAALRGHRLHSAARELTRPRVIRSASHAEMQCRSKLQNCASCARTAALRGHSALTSPEGSRTGGFSRWCWRSSALHRAEADRSPRRGGRAPAQLSGRREP